MNHRLGIAFRFSGVLAILATTFALGFWAGVNDQGPQHRALVRVRRTGTPGNAGSGITRSVSASYGWYNIRMPGEAARLRTDEKRLADQGIEHYVTEGVYEWSLRPKVEPGLMRSHR